MELGNLTDQLIPAEPYNSPGNQALVENLVINQLICPSDELASDPIVDDIRTAGNRNPLIAQMTWYVGSMGPTVPDRHEPFGNDPQTAMGCNFGNEGFSSEPPCSPCFLSQSCPDNSACVGMICRTKDRIKFRQITDGLSNTIMLGETIPIHTKWNCVFCENFVVASTHIPLGHMVSGNREPTLFWESSGIKSNHPGGAHVIMGDNSGKFLSDSIDYFLYNALGSRAASEVASFE